MSPLPLAVQPSSSTVKPTTGTSILALEYDGGVVIAADTRVSMGTYICNRASNKITALCDNVYLARSGSAADTQIVSDYGEIDGSLHRTLLGLRLFNVDVWGC